MEQEKINRLQWILDDAVARGEIPGAILMVRKEGKETVYLESDDSGGAGTDRSGRSGM